jgi:hypothetical protein
MREVLRPYFDPASGVPAADRYLVAMLYEPFYQALDRMP